MKLFLDVVFVLCLLVSLVLGLGGVFALKDLALEVIRTTDQARQIAAMANGVVLIGFFCLSGLFALWARVAQTERQRLTD